jgi:Domain of unknown function (DUF1905)/Bacteriocin-protection, YdeI or OmpD-Associated
VKDNPIVNKKVKLEKFDGKGGWTYARLPEVKPDKKAWFNWVRVSGFIDDHEIKAYHLMPMGNGQLFLPVKAAIRKKIKKDVGDTITVRLYLDNDPIEIPQALLECLREDPEAQQYFFKLTESEKKQAIDWIYSAKKEETRINRMAEFLNLLSKGRTRSSG